MSKYHNAFQGFVKAFTAAAKPGVKGNPTTIIGVAPSKNIKKFQEQKEKIIKTTDAYKKKVNDPEVKKKMNETTSKTLGKISQILKGKKVEKKAMGGRIGLKGGGSDMSSTTNKSINSLKNFLEDKKNRKKSNISDKADRAKKAFDMIQTNLNTDFKTMNRTQDSKGRFKDRKSMRKYIDDVSTASTRDSAKVRIGRKFGSKPKTNVEKIKETFAPKKSGNVPSKLKGFSKLPEAVQQKMNKKLAKKV